jgi:hypothetical protein
VKTTGIRLNGVCLMRIYARKIARHFPYRVVVRARSNGLVSDVVADMREYCRMFELRCRMQTMEALDDTIWCFANPVHARRFQRAFGGDLMTVTEAID